MAPNLMISHILLRNLINMTLEKIDFVEDYIGEADERLNERRIIGETIIGETKKSHLYKHLQKINHVSLSCID